MKPITPALLLSAFFLLSSLASPSLADDNSVLDTDGDELKRGVGYYITPAVTDVAGGPTLESRRNDSQICDLNVALERRPGAPGLPVTFLPVDQDEDKVHLSTDLNIEFQTFSVCSRVWRIKLDEADGRYYVVISGIVVNRVPETLSNRFKIESFLGAYKLVFCPSVCDTCRPVCGALGVYSEGDRLWLGIRDDAPFAFKFKKAQDL